MSRCNYGKGIYNLQGRSRGALFIWADKEAYIERCVAYQMPGNRPDMRQRALFVRGNAAWCKNKILVAELTVDILRAAIVVATEGNTCTPFPAS